MNDRIYGPVGNYYGTPYVYKTEEGKYFYGIENYDGCDEEEVSETFYLVYAQEFNKN